MHQGAFRDGENIKFTIANWSLLHFSHWFVRRCSLDVSVIFTPTTNLPTPPFYRIPLFRERRERESFSMWRLCSHVFDSHCSTLQTSFGGKAKQQTNSSPSSTHLSLSLFFKTKPKPILEKHKTHTQASFSVSCLYPSNNPSSHVKYMLVNNLLTCMYIV